jgi:type II secretory pathway pseudopilin PulG
MIKKHCLHEQKLHPSIACITTACKVPPGILAQPRTPTTRFGYTLLETLIALSLLSTLAISSVTIMTTITEDGIALAQARQSRRDAQRIAKSLRQDASKTLRTNIEITTWPVTLHHESSKTIYHWDEAEDILTRTESTEQENLGSERFLLPKGSKPAMSAETNRLTLRIDLAGENNPWVIEGDLKDGDS